MAPPFRVIPIAPTLWLEPELVAEITYAEVMQGRLRDPVFRQLVQAVV